MNFQFQVLPLILSGTLTGLAQQPLNLGWLAWISLLPLLLVLSKLGEWKDYCKAGYIWGVSYNLTTIYWLAANIGTTKLIGLNSMAAAVNFLALNYLVVFFIYGLLKNRYPYFGIYLLPITWISVEFIRSFGALGFPWISLANTQTDYLTLIQNAEVTGLYGISFWVVLINLVIYIWLKETTVKRAYLCFLIFTLPWVTGILLTPDYVDNGKKLNITVVQPNIHLSEKWKKGAAKANIFKLLDASKESINDNADLIIWPESAPPAYILQGNQYYLKMIQKKLGESLLLSGVPYFSDSEDGRQYFNSVALISTDSVLQLYHKLKLVPMAEYIPLSGILPSLKKLNLGQANFEHGEEFTVFEVNGVKLCAMVCIESTLPQLSREFVNRGAEALIYVVNDGWYEQAPEPQQHAKQAVFRAIETRRPVTRCANTGISLVIDPTGNITHKIPLNEAGVISTEIFSSNRETFYLRYGDIFSLLNCFITFILLIGLLKKT